MKHQLQNSGATVVITALGCLEVARAAAAESGVETIILMGGEGGGDMFPLSAMMSGPLESQSPVNLDTHTLRRFPIPPVPRAFPKG